MFDCVGYVFGSGLVFHIDKKKKKRKKKSKKGEGGETKIKNRATFAVFNLPSGGQTQLTEF